MHWDHEKITKEEWNWNGTKKIKLKPKQPIKKKKKKVFQRKKSILTSKNWPPLVVGGTWKEIQIDSAYRICAVWVHEDCILGIYNI